LALVGKGREHVSETVCGICGNLTSEDIYPSPNMDVLRLFYAKGCRVDSILTRTSMFEAYYACRYYRLRKPDPLR
jgi:hypothetical protein